MFSGILRRLFQNDGAGPLLRKELLPEIPEGTPVGTIIMFYGTSAPEGYLPCTGVSFSASAYPKLYALMGNNNTTPDMRGLFARGYDPTGVRDPNGTGRGIGSHQGDAGRNLTGSHFYGTDADTFATVEASGVFALGSVAADPGILTMIPAQAGAANWRPLTFDASRQWGAATSTEFRPMNISLLYCIKHD